MPKDSADTITTWESQRTQTRRFRGWVSYLPNSRYTLRTGGYLPLIRMVDPTLSNRIEEEFCKFSSSQTRRLISQNPQAAECSSRSDNLSSTLNGFAQTCSSAHLSQSFATVGDGRYDPKSAMFRISLSAEPLLTENFHTSSSCPPLSQSKIWTWQKFPMVGLNR